MLAQQVSSYDVGGRNFHVQEKPMHEDLYFFYAGTDQSAMSIDQVGSAGSPSTVAKSARPTALVYQADSPMTSSINSPEKLPNQPNVTSSDVGADLDDWRTPLLRYLHDLSAKVDKNVR
jgi:hypothetical protein